jgi:hypothetical protein
MKIKTDTKECDNSDRKKECCLPFKYQLYCDVFGVKHIDTPPIHLRRPGCWDVEGSSCVWTLPLLAGSVPLSRLTPRTQTLILAPHLSEERDVKMWQCHVSSLVWGEMLLWFRRDEVTVSLVRPEASTTLTGEVLFGSVPCNKCCCHVKTVCLSLVAISGETQNDT